MSELQGLQSIQAELNELGVATVAISSESVETLQGKKDTHQFTFPLLADPNLKAIDSFGLRHQNGHPVKGDISRPALILFDKDGKVVFRWLTENWRIRPTPEDILAAVKKGPTSC